MGLKVIGVSLLCLQLAIGGTVKRQVPGQEYAEQLANLMPGPSTLISPASSFVGNFVPGGSSSPSNPEPAASEQRATIQEQISSMTSSFPNGFSNMIPTGNFPSNFNSLGYPTPPPTGGEKKKRATIQEQIAGFTSNIPGAGNFPTLPGTDQISNMIPSNSFFGGSTAPATSAPASRKRRASIQEQIAGFTSNIPGAGNFPTFPGTDQISNMIPSNSFFGGSTAPATSAPASRKRRASIQEQITSFTSNIPGAGNFPTLPGTDQISNMIPSNSFFGGSTAPATSAPASRKRRASIQEQIAGFTSNIPGASNFPTFPGTDQISNMIPSNSFFGGSTAPATSAPASRKRRASIQEQIAGFTSNIPGAGNFPTFPGTDQISNMIPSNSFFGGSTAPATSAPASRKRRASIQEQIAGFTSNIPGAGNFPTFPGTDQISNMIPSNSFFGGSTAPATTAPASRKRRASIQEQIAGFTSNIPGAGNFPSFPGTDQISNMIPSNSFFGGSTAPATSAPASRKRRASIQEQIAGFTSNIPGAGNFPTFPGTDQISNMIPSNSFFGGSSAPATTAPASRKRRASIQEQIAGFTSNIPGAGNFPTLPGTDQISNMIPSNSFFGGSTAPATTAPASRKRRASIQEQISGFTNSFSGAGAGNLPSFPGSDQFTNMIPSNSFFPGSNTPSYNPTPTL